MSATSMKYDKRHNEKIDPKWCDSQSDCTLISTDNIIFMVPKYHLQSASYVLRHALEMKSPLDNGTSPITLTSSFETSTTVRLFLDFIDGSWIPNIESTTHTHINDLLSFTDKWSCTQAHHSLLRCLPKFFEASSEDAVDYYPRWPVEVFVIAARWDALDICVLAIEQGHWWEAQSAAVKNFGAMAGCAVLDPKAMPARMVEQIPPLYMWALARVFGSLGTKWPKDWGKAGKEFKSLIEQWGHKSDDSQEQRGIKRKDDDTNASFRVATKSD
ncbi:hypothetical protein CI109_101310 [Kwoniella shandongensis]|uniref:Uncharacterized protein n=1 Tax=Kwoniella shandongensis TaxID=1734106 RepID=A0A5M6BU33_9TREE|nr:uncharacterized protein CI109_005310 [Kwoniella shandongensis]KAA5526354.1 hypothetical protein CI109_005310 [Kwoniella shandongensis]